MRISEKTIELNFCAELYAQVRPVQRIVWFGLTQAQEAKAGFDTCAKIEATLFIFQFKASNKITKNSARRFKASHDQLLKLQQLAGGRRGVYYVFPSFGNTREFSRDPSVVRNSQVADLADFPIHIPIPTKRDGTPRKDGSHYVDVTPGLAEFHSDPFNVDLIDGAKLERFPERLWSISDPGNVGISTDNFNTADAFWEAVRSIGPHSLAMGIGR
jgi:hypothetical protein